MSDLDRRFSDAQALAATGRSEEALAEATDLLDEEPEHVGLLLLKAGLLRQSGAGDSALALYERAVRVAPEAADAWNEHARCLHDLGRNDEALASARRAQELLARPENERHWTSVCLTLMWCLREKRMFREALALAEQCLARTPDAVVAEWASQIEQDLAEAERDRC